MNHGDIKRLESTFLPWIFIFQATKKYKYAKHMVRLLMDIYYEYPSALKKAVRYSMLVNPTRKRDGFQAPDWCTELGNLYTKIIYGGGGSNHTVERIIKESMLKQIFRDIHLTFKKNLVLTHLTTRHCQPDMTSTYEAILKHLKATKAHEFVPGHLSDYLVPDLFACGQAAMWDGFEDCNEDEDEQHWRM
ncbi:hypothetical protein PHLCEN_2v12607 [Hermanssonia centrifuga]|uniref:DUF6589 domain-containing protein n=1 Tax=Hermanssonia centrifuga TaxID=98765 RepID=A0A2R6NGL2_9APHY|nr:hypothetical protein PHLCEN_2v12607 [Hermanssonia centrifuga]